MAEINIKEELKNTRFHIPKKESYTLQDMFDMEEQLKEKLANVAEKSTNNIVKELSSFQEKIKETEATWQKKVVETETTWKSQLEKLTQEKEEYVNKTTSLENELKPLKNAFIKQEANELLSGLVAKGAEFDTYQLISEKLKSVKFKDSDKIEDRKEKILPIVEELFNDKPYLKFVKGNGANDSKKIIVKKTADETEIEQQTPSRRFGGFR